MSLDLAERLRAGTQDAHTSAENTAFMKCFLKGVVEREPLRKLLGNLYFVYSTLEAELRRYATDPLVQPIYFPELNRQANLDRDLEFYYGADWRSQVTPSPSGQRYVARIQVAAHMNPVLLVAHSYTRYMGDLSGGQSLKQIIRSALNLPAAQGTALYEFEHIATPEARRNFKDRYRQALNQIPVDDALIQAIVNEANVAFALNRDVVQELEADVKQAIGERVFDLLTRQDRPGSTLKCPHAARQQQQEMYQVQI